jgi:hypothetical protein
VQGARRAFLDGLGRSFFAAPCFFAHSLSSGVAKFGYSAILTFDFHEIENGDEVKWLSPSCRFVVALHLPDGRR